MSNDKQFIIDSWDPEIEILKELNPYPKFYKKKTLILGTTWYLRNLIP
jgi:hypothetical protein